MATLIDIDKLTTDQRLDLIGELWDSLDHAPVALSEEQRAVLDERIADMERDPSGNLSWEDVRADLARARARR